MTSRKKEITKLIFNVTELCVLIALIYVLIQL